MQCKHFFYQGNSHLTEEYKVWKNSLHNILLSLKQCRWSYNCQNITLCLRLRWSCTISLNYKVAIWWVIFRMTAPAIIFIILLCISWFSRVVSNHPNCHHHILHAKLRVGMVPKSLFATKMLQLCFHCLIYMYIWLCRVQGLTYDRCIQVLHLVHTKQIFDHMPKNCFVQYMQIHNSLKKKNNTFPNQIQAVSVAWHNLAYHDKFPPSIIIFPAKISYIRHI